MHASGKVKALFSSRHIELEGWSGWQLRLEQERNSGLACCLSSLFLSCSQLLDDFSQASAHSTNVAFATSQPSLAPSTPYSFSSPTSSRRTTEPFFFPSCICCLLVFSFALCDSRPPYQYSYYLNFTTRIACICEQITMIWKNKKKLEQNLRLSAGFLFFRHVLIL